MGKNNMNKFVAREFVELSNEEKQLVTDELRIVTESMISRFGANVEIANIGNTRNGSATQFKVLFDKNVSGRSEYNGSRFDLSGFSLFVVKSKGEIEISWEKREYEHYDGFCYDISMKANGTYKPYKTRNNGSWELINYEYDSDLKQLLLDNLPTAITEFVRVIA